MPKHRRSDIYPAPTPFGAPADVAELWPEPVGYGRGAPVARRTDPRAALRRDDYDDYEYVGTPVARRTVVDTRAAPRRDDYDDYEYVGPSVDAGWAPVPDDRSWQDWEDWQREVGPPIMHPDHPSAPVPMVQFPDWEESTSDRRGGSLSGRFPGPGTVRFRSGRSLSTDSLWTEQFVPLADEHAAQLAQEAEEHAAAIRHGAERQAAAITQQATGQASAIREAAEREAAAIREDAELEATELRARLDSMWNELGRMAAFVTENLSAPALPAIAPPLPAAGPDAGLGLPEAPAALPGPWAALTRPAPPDGRPDAAPRRTDPRPRPATDRPSGPRATPAAAPARAPGNPPAGRPAQPGPDGPARQTATPAKQGQGQTQGRQRRAMRIATAGTAALVSIAAIGAATYTGIHGLSFFVFRESGQGETPGNFTDAKFLARQAAAQHHDSTPKGRHHKATGSK